MPGRLVLTQHDEINSEEKKGERFLCYSWLVGPNRQITASQNTSEKFENSNISGKNKTGSNQWVGNLRRYGRRMKIHVLSSKGTQ